MELKGRILCCGDIHGAHKALIQVLERSNFDYDKDTLIQLGDICDGWPEVYECVEELLKIKNLISIKGNHDSWFDEYIDEGIHPVRWLQGGLGTLKSYVANVDREVHIQQSMEGYVTNLTNVDIPKTHIEFFKNQIPFYIDSKNRCFVHGGFDRQFNIEDQDYSMLYWDRSLWNKALSAGQYYKLNTANDFSEIFIGHTSTTGWNTIEPMSSGGITNLDTGAGWKGVLTIMDVDTKEYWQSDLVFNLYKNEKGRN